MHSFGHTFAQSSQPMHLNQSMLCWPRYARGSSTFWYGYRWVTGLRPPGMTRLRPGIVTSACLSVAIIGPIVPTFLRGRGSASDQGDFIGILSFLHIHQLALACAHEAALLRPDPAASLRLDLRAELQEAVDQGLGPHGAAGDEDVRRDEGVGTLHDAVGIVVRTAANRALAHRDDPLRLRHLLVEPTDSGPELEGDRPIQQEDVALPRGRSVNHAETLHVVPRVRGRGHLDRAAHDPEVKRPCRVPLRPVEELAHEALLEPLDEGAARPALHRRVDVLLDPLHEILGSEADDVRLLRGLDHGLTGALRLAVRRSQVAPMAGAFLTLPSLARESWGGRRRHVPNERISGRA